ncbi:MAG: hypothetical protein BAJALOKI2v1_30096 [Promethearchaeota archaeon]|nr:MAG: hypothetical protein BAJALOKI2v1_30096 [Candidatus Lokiarchaeota archaeon]
MGTLQDIWILDESGATIYSRVFDPKVNEQLFGALMSALNQFAEQVSEGGISSFELSDTRFNILKKKDYLFIANSESGKNKKAKKELNKICDTFFDLYGQKIESGDWDGDVTLFEDFGEHIEDSLKSTLKQFKDAFW